MSDLKRLKMELLNETIYDTSVRPSLNQSQSIEVSVAFTMEHPLYFHFNPLSRMAYPTLINWTSPFPF